MQVLVSLQSRGVEAFGPAVVAYAREPGAVPQLRGFFEKYPRAEASVLSVLAADAANADLVLALASNDRNPDPDWRGPLISGLAAKGQYGKAYSTWAGLSRLRPSRGVFNPAFAVVSAPPPFNWAYPQSGEGVAEPDGKGGLDILYYGRVNAVLASQLLLLPPGRYRLAMNVAEGGRNEGATHWILRCAAGGKVLGDLPLKAGAVGVAFAVPPGCEAQWLELQGVAGDMPQTTELKLQELRLASENPPMTRVKEAILPAYLFLCLLIGGSAQGIWANALLQLLAIAILAWSAVTSDPQPMTRTRQRPAAACRAALAAVRRSTRAASSRPLGRDSRPAFPCRGVRDARRAAAVAAVQPGAL